MVASGCIELVPILLAVLEAAVAIAIAVVVRHVLWSYQGSWRWAPSWWSKTSADNVCLMTSRGANLCVFAYVMVAVGLVASAAALLTQCFSRGARRGRCCAFLDLFIAALLTPLWAAAAIAATVYGARADAAGVPQRGARTAVWVMAWAEAGLWGLSVLFAMATRRSYRKLSETELTASLAGGSRYSRYQEQHTTSTPFSSSSSKWRDAKAAYLGARAPAPASPKMVDP